MPTVPFAGCCDDGETMAHELVWSGAAHILVDLTSVCYSWRQAMCSDLQYGHYQNGFMYCM